MRRCDDSAHGEPHAGSRWRSASHWPNRAANGSVLFAAGADYGQNADAEVLAFAMIEAAEAMKNLDEIVSTPGLDRVYIGPGDLTLGLTGRRYPTGFDRQEPEMVEAIQLVLKKAKAAGIRAGPHNGMASYAAKAVGWGFDLVTISNDVRLLAGAAQQSVAQARRLIGGAPEAGAEKMSNVD